MKSNKTVKKQNEHFCRITLPCHPTIFLQQRNRYPQTVVLDMAEMKEQMKRVS